MQKKLIFLLRFDMLENSIGEREGSSLLSCIRSYCFTPVIIDFIIFNNSM